MSAGGLLMFAVALNKGELIETIIALIGSGLVFWLLSVFIGAIHKEYINRKYHEHKIKMLELKEK